MGRLSDEQDSTGGEFPLGGVRTITTKDGKIITIYRANRPYAEDLADAYNAAMDPAARKRGAHWFVAPNGELKLGFTDASIRENRKRAERELETERARYLRHQFEPVV